MKVRSRLNGRRHIETDGTLKTYDEYHRDVILRRRRCGTGRVPSTRWSTEKWYGNSLSERERMRYK